MKDNKLQPVRPHRSGSGGMWVEPTNWDEPENVGAVVGRVAQALCKADGREPDLGPAPYEGWTPNWHEYRDFALAALQALIEAGPSEEMKAAAARIPHARDEEIYLAMLRAALPKDQTP